MIATTTNTPIITKRFAPDEVAFDWKTACKFLKLHKSSPRFDAVQKHVLDLYDEIKHTFKPRVQYRLCTVAANKSVDEILLDNVQDDILRNEFFYKQSKIFPQRMKLPTDFFKNIRWKSNLVGSRRRVAGQLPALCGAAIYRRLNRAKQAAIFLLTIGDEFEQFRSTRENDFQEHFFLDAIASTVTQGAFENLRRALQAYAEDQHLRLTPQLSPGYPGWELCEQKKIFALLKPAKIGVRLTESFYMVPQKSLSGVFGLVA